MLEIYIKIKKEDEISLREELQYFSCVERVESTQEGVCVFAEEMSGMDVEYLSSVYDFEKITASTL